jgi:DNA-binding PadR family transcriptional regulator
VEQVTAMDVILGLLHQRALTGYEVKHSFQTLFSFFFDASYGTIYPTLSKMEKMGYITKESVRQDNRPAKNVYTLTDKGREQFKDYLTSSLEDEVFRSDFLVRMYFGHHLESETVIGWIGKILTNDRAGLRDLEQKKKQYWDQMNPTQQICITMGIEQYRTKIRVLEEGLGKLQALGT